MGQDNKKKKKTANAIVLVTLWKIWKARNEKTFNGRRTPPWRIIEEIKSQSYLWVKNRGRNMITNWGECGFTNPSEKLKRSKIEDFGSNKGMNTAQGWEGGTLVLFGVMYGVQQGNSPDIGDTRRVQNNSRCGFTNPSEKLKRSKIEDFGSNKGMNTAQGWEGGTLVLFGVMYGVQQGNSPDIGDTRRVQNNSRSLLEKASK
ncbi:hypothetical protein LXL04_036837 [Taraxacum kok-saghyz]